MGPARGSVEMVAAILVVVLVVGCSALALLHGGSALNDSEPCRPAPNRR